MASLNSPGVSVTVIDESQYTPTAAGSIAYVLVATAENKTNPSGTIASGTTSANAEKIITVTSQRDLVNMFGTPTFQLDAAGNPINGSELNEYGLLAAYSALGVSNQLYVQRADIDLNQLQGTATRPTGAPSNGAYWLDLTATNLGIYEWDSTGFNLITPTVITDSTQLTLGVPNQSIGKIGDYAVNATSTSNQIFYKGYNNVWTAVGSDSWKSVTPAIVGLIGNPGNLTSSQYMVINNVSVHLTSGNTVTGAATAINNAGITGVSASVNSVGQLEIYANSAAKSNGTTVDGNLAIAPGTSIGQADCAIPLGLIQSDIAATVSGNTYTYGGPTVQFSGFNNTPQWAAFNAIPRPYGSVWFETTSTGNGASWGIKQYSSALNSWVLLGAPLYSHDTSAINNLDPTGGGVGIAAGTVYIKYDALNPSPVDSNHSNGTGAFRPYVKNVSGVTKVVGAAPSGTFAFHAGDSFTLSVSVPGVTGLSSAYTITIPGSGNAIPATTLVSTILAANIPNVTAAIETSGAISLTHLAGGTIKIVEVTGTPLQTAGITGSSPATHVQKLYAADGVTVTGYLVSPFTPLVYTYSTTAPFSNPADGTLWYYNTALQVDILINDGTNWKSYRTVSSDARGYNLVATDPNGPILSASKPTTQSDGVTNVVAGDLWIDTSDLENYPVIYRYTGTTWTLINNTDQVGVNGIVFADARWSAAGTVDPITGSLANISDLLLAATVLDADAPDYRLYARGTLLFNTRRSGYNVKRFESNYFPTSTVTGAWVSHSGLDQNGVPYFGHKAQRHSVVLAMKSAIASSTALREEQTQFNLICTPGYPELIQDMITLNNDRLQTAFIIGDSPLDLSSDSTTLQAWTNNTNLAADNGENGLVSHDDYTAVYYPSGLATNLDGNSVVVPASHMMLRTYIRSDNVSYPWFAPAGVRRGVIDNVSSIGYIDITDNNLFRSIGVTNGLRDILYENNVNPITVLPGVGLVAYGQKTRASTTSALDRVNVARLTCYLRTVLAKVAAPFIFEPNDKITRDQVKGAFEAVLNDVVAKRGIYDYLVVCDTTNNTPDRIDRNELYVDIAIQPVKAIEFVYIPVRLLNTGAALTIA